MRVEGRALAVTIDQHHELLTWRHRLRLGDHLLDRDDARLRAEDEVLVGLELPERPQAHRVGREDALVHVAGDQRDRALCVGAHGLAQVHVEGVELVGQRGDLGDDRRHHHLHRLREGEAVPPGQRLDRAVEVLRVRVALADRNVEHPRLLAKLLNRVDLAVVAEDAEGLDPGERGPGVGRIAVVPEGADRLEALVREVRVVAAEDLGSAHHLVDAGPSREGGDVDAELLLQRDLQVEEGPVGVGGLGDQACELPELRLLLARRRAEGGRVDRAQPLGQDPEARLAQELAGAMANLLQVLRALDEYMGDGERIIESQRRVVPALPDLLGPDLGRDVDQQPAAVALAVDVAGAVEHLLEGLERQGHGLVARGRVAADRRVDRTRVLVLDARRRDEGPIRALRGKALTLWGRVLQFDSGSAPSSSGRATGWDQRRAGL